MSCSLKLRFSDILQLYRNLSRNPFLTTIKHAIWRLSSAKNSLSLIIDMLPLERSGRRAATVHSWRPPSTWYVQRFASMTILHRPTYIKKVERSEVSVYIFTFVKQAGRFRNQEMAMMKVRSYCLCYSNNACKESALPRPVTNVFSVVDVIYCNMIVNKKLGLNSSAFLNYDDNLYRCHKIKSYNSSAAKSLINKFESWNCPAELT